MLGSSLIKVLWFAVLLVAVDATPHPSSNVKSPVAQNKAIVPTGTGQIGINPVDLGFGDPAAYSAGIQKTDSKYITLNEGTTKWIGVNSEYLDKTTINPTSTTEVHFIKATGTADNGEKETTLLFSEPLADTLKISAINAVDACSGGKSKHRRGDGNFLPRAAAEDVLECLVNSAHTIATGATLAKFAADQAWTALALEAASNAAAVVTTAIATMTYVQVNKFLVLMGVFVIALSAFLNIVAAFGKGLTGPWSSNWNIAKIKLPQAGKGMGGKPSDEKKCNGKEKRTKYSPLCIEPTCLGIGEKCTLRPNELCPCWEISKLHAPQIINQSYFDFQQEFLKEVVSSIKDDLPAPKTTPICNMSDVSAFPQKLFQNVYNKFCDEVVQKANYISTTWIVDSSGNQIPPKKDKAQKRTPPMNPETFKDYRIDLFFNPDPNTPFICGESCKDAFNTIANSKCGAADSQKYSMTKEASLNVGCGNYTYKIKAPPKKSNPSSPPSSASSSPSSLPDPKGPPNCYKDGQFGVHNYVSSYDCITISRNFCRHIPEVHSDPMKAGEKPIIMEEKGSLNQAPLHFEVRWIDGCTTYPSQSSDMDICDQILWENCDKCKLDIKGKPQNLLGGWKDYGCLRYDFKPQIS